MLDIMPIGTRGSEPKRRTQLEIPGVLTASVADVTDRSPEYTIHQYLEIGSDGALGKLTPGEYLITVRGSEQIKAAFELKAARTVEPIPYVNTQYHKVVHVRTDNRGENRTRCPNNTMIVARSKCQDRGEIYQIAIISQNGNFFLVVESLTGYRFYKRAGKKVCPALKNWSSLRYALAELVQERDLKSLDPDRDGYTNTLDSLHARIEKKRVTWPIGMSSAEGIVLEWNSAEGNGVVLTQSGKALVTWPDIRTSSDTARAYLTVGQHVAFTMLHTSSNCNPNSIACRRVHGVTVLG